MFGESLPFENLLMKLTKEIFERIAKLPFSSHLSPFAFRRFQKFDEIDSSLDIFDVEKATPLPLWTTDVEYTSTFAAKLNFIV